jgi:tartrate dehydratase alpha subunit/fumarate hydratase class I-like protein
LLDTTGMAGKVFTVTVEVDDGLQHTASGSCSISVSAAPKN